MMSKKRLRLSCAGIRHTSAIICHSAGGVCNTPRWRKEEGSNTHTQYDKVPAPGAQIKLPEVGGK